MTQTAPAGGGQTLADRYRMTKKVGDGTFGEVSLAKKLDTGDIVAIKRYEKIIVSILSSKTKNIFDEFNTYVYVG